MIAVGLEELKNRLRECVRIAARGETVLVTDRDRVVAQLRPPLPERSAVIADARLAAAVRRGWRTPPRVGAGASPPPRLPVARFDEVQGEFARDREER